MEGLNYLMLMHKIFGINSKYVGARLWKNLTFYLSSFLATIFINQLSTQSVVQSHWTGECTSLTPQLLKLIDNDKKFSVGWVAYPCQLGQKMKIVKLM